MFARWLDDIDRRVLIGATAVGVVAAVPMTYLGEAWLPPRMCTLPDELVLPLRVAGVALWLSLPLLVGGLAGRWYGGSRPGLQGAFGGAVVALTAGGYGWSAALQAGACAPWIAAAEVGQPAAEMVRIMSATLATICIVALAVPALGLLAGAALGGLAASVVGESDGRTAGPADPRPLALALRFAGILASLLVAAATPHLMSMVDSHFGTVSRGDLTSAEAAVRVAALLGVLVWHTLWLGGLLGLLGRLRVPGAWWTGPRAAGSMAAATIVLLLPSLRTTGLTSVAVMALFLALVVRSTSLHQDAPEHAPQRALSGWWPPFEPASWVIVLLLLVMAPLLTIGLNAALVSVAMIVDLTDGVPLRADSVEPYPRELVWLVALIPASIWAGWWVPSLIIEAVAGRQAT